MTTVAEWERMARDANRAAIEQWNRADQLERERDEARAEVVRLGNVAQAWIDDCATLTRERDEARADAWDEGARAGATDNPEESWFWRNNPYRAAIRGDA